MERDLFRYGDEPLPSPAPTAEAARQEPRAVEPEAVRATPPPLRLVGFVRRAGQLCAAVALGPEGLNVLCAGDSASGHRLLAVDEERGVRLALPDATELDLPAPR